MKYIFKLVIIALIITWVNGQESKRAPEKLVMTLAMIAETHDPIQHIFVINGVVAYKSVEALKKMIKDLPAGSSITWSPGCRRIGNEPLLSSKDEMDDFKKYCESCSVKFELIPSG